MRISISNIRINWRSFEDFEGWACCLAILFGATLTWRAWWTFFTVHNAHTISKNSNRIVTHESEINTWLMITNKEVRTQFDDIRENQCMTMKYSRKCCSNPIVNVVIRIVDLDSEAMTRSVKAYVIKNNENSIVDVPVLFSCH